MRKNQLFLVACFVSVSFFALSSFIDSNAWGKTKEECLEDLCKPKKKPCKKLSKFNGWCLFLQDMNFKASLGYTDLTSKLETGGVPGTEIDDTETYSVGIGYFNKKFLSQIFIENKKAWQGGIWDFVIDPFEFNAGINFSRAFPDNGLIVTRDLKDTTGFNVGIVYNLPMENLYWNLNE